MSKATPIIRRKKRHERVRMKIEGSNSRPRLCVFRSLNHIYAQVIDDEKGSTLGSASSLDPEIKGNGTGKTKTEIAKLVGTLIAKQASAQGIKTVVFDRGGYQYHGRVKALAEAARKNGLKF